MSGVKNKNAVHTQFCDPLHKKNSFQVKIFLLLCLLLNLKVLLALWIEFGITKLTEVQATTVRPVITYGQFPFFATVPEPLLIPTNTRFV